jgi:ABC-type glutathione transport system ATPase component
MHRHHAPSAPQPRLAVADEPAAGLNVSVRAQLLRLTAGLQERPGAAFLIISHDYSVVRSMAQRVAVVYLGRLVETKARGFI